MAHLYYQFYLIDVRRNMLVCNEAYKIFQCHTNLNTVKHYALLVSKYYFRFYFSIYEHDFFYKHDKGCNETQPNAKPQRERVPNIIISSCITLFQLKNNKE